MDAIPDADEGEEEQEEEDMDMDMDLESEEEDQTPVTKASSRPAAAATSGGSSARVKTAQGRDAHASAGRSGGKAGSNPYPLEGKYIDEDDREE